MGVRPTNSPSPALPPVTCQEKPCFLPENLSVISTHDKCEPWSQAAKTAALMGLSPQVGVEDVQE